MKNRTKLTVALLATSLLLGGCASQDPKKPSGIEQRIESAHSPSEHQAIAGEYEKQAATDKATSRMHQGLANKYKYITTPKGISPGSAYQHCSNLAKLYEQAAAENLELAKLHREAADAAK
jgi:hypothetical protein